MKAEQLSDRCNNFDLLRLFASLQVITGHFFHRLDIDSSNIPWFQVVRSFPGVMIFFVISGFLITESYKRNGNEPNFYLNRFLRIFPALFVLLVATIVVVLFTKDANVDSIISYDFARTAFGFLTYFPDTNPAFAEHFGAGFLNGSLWTIPVEFTFYLLLPAFFGAFKGHEKMGAWIIFFLSSISSYFQLGYLCVFSWLYLFFVGVLFNLYWKQLRNFICGKFLYWLSAFLFLRFVLGWNTTYWTWNIADIVMNVLLGFVTMSAAYTMPRLSRFLCGQDLSYGIYLFHGLIINIVIELNMPKTISTMIFVMVISIVCGFLSWNIIEKRALSFKKKH